ncbi:unnamed protein product [Rotaria sp. Silwood2]|nr:unnamed protein product [Rotaria sp. Silwood2]
MVQSGKEKLFLYRGMKLTCDQIEKFQDNIGKLISINGFFTTSSLRSTALNQAMKPSRTNDFIPVLLEIQFNLQNLSNSAIVANTVHFSKLPCEEQEDIIFDSNATFRLESVKMEDDIWLIQMIASNEGQIIKDKYIKDSHRQMEDLSIKILFGRLMCDMGQWDQSQHFFQHLLNSYNEDLAMVEYSLGEVLQWKGEWSEARKYYDHAYDGIIHVKPTRFKDLANILFNIGEILYQEGKYEEACDYYEQALALRKKSILLPRMIGLAHRISNAIVWQVMFTRLSVRFH